MARIETLCFGQRGGAPAGKGKTLTLTLSQRERGRSIRGGRRRQLVAILFSGEWRNGGKYGEAGAAEVFEDGARRCGGGRNGADIHSGIGNWPRWESGAERAGYCRRHRHW